jgi:hypothetical protein
MVLWLDRRDHGTHGSVTKSRDPDANVHTASTRSRALQCRHTDSQPISCTHTCSATNGKAVSAIAEQSSDTPTDTACKVAALPSLTGRAVCSEVYRRRSMVLWLDRRDHGMHGSVTKSRDPDANVHTASTRSRALQCRRTGSQPISCTHTCAATNGKTYSP